LRAGLQASQNDKQDKARATRWTITENDVEMPERWDADQG